MTQHRHPHKKKRKRERKRKIQRIDGLSLPPWLEMLQETNSVKTPSFLPAAKPAAGLGKESVLLDIGFVFSDQPCIVFFGGVPQEKWLPF